ncbi:MAG TPA: outer membrane protein assembly factor BamD [Verrucomicrobiae bacterium]|nr:outer membrane protein assembly factor BamD [Verrucomicrobiae bacterium]
MNRRLILPVLIFVFAALLPFRSPAPLIHVPGEGWYYEPAGGNLKWVRQRASDQLQVAQDAFKQKDYATASHAAHRILRVWPQSDYAPAAQFLLAECLEAEGRDEMAFNSYQALIQKYPTSKEYNTALRKQYEISNRFLAGEWTRIGFGYIPFPMSLDDTANMFAKIVNNGPYSDVAPHAQLHVGATRDKQKNYEEAVKAYELAADRYHDQPDIAADAMYHQGLSYEREAEKAEYDQSTAGKAIAAYTDFITIFPDDKRVAAAQKAILALKEEQVRGNFEIAKFYEKGHKWMGAVIYYNEVLQLDPNSSYAAIARQRIETLKPKIRTEPTASN